jgi:prepilin-type N-terminal cleavage/methylation domain-containing protein
MSFSLKMGRKAPIKFKTGYLQGFTLSEIMITLAILGICLAVSIPMLAQSRDKSARTASFREAILSIQNIYRQGILNDELNYTNFGTYFIERLNTIKTCDDAAGNGCITAAQAAGIGGEASQPGVVLPNSLTITGLDDGFDYGSNRWSNCMEIDWNGGRGPNTLGNDILALCFCYGTEDCDYVGMKANTMFSVVTPPLPTTAQTIADNDALYKEVMGN